MNDERALDKFRCQECGEMLIRTSARYKLCPNGHGPLIQVGHMDDWADVEFAEERRDFEKKLNKAYGKQD